MIDRGSPQPPAGNPKRRYQFGLAALLLAAVPVSVLAASLGGMLGQGGSPGLPIGYFVLMSTAAPLGLLLIAGLLHWAATRWKRRHHRP